LFKQIQDCANYSEAVCVLIGQPQHINVGYAKMFGTGHLMSPCCWWNEKHSIEKTWTQFKSHFAAAHRQHEQMQGESDATDGCHSANADVGQTEDQMAEATIGELANLSTTTPLDRGMVTALTQANARLFKQLEDNSNELWELKALIKKERTESLANTVSTILQEIIDGRMDTKLVTLAHLSPVNSRSRVTKRRQLEWITWVAFRTTRNDIQGRQL
jgi:hypothetical protein